MRVWNLNHRMAYSSLFLGLLVGLLSALGIVGCSQKTGNQQVSLNGGVTAQGQVIVTESDKAKLKDLREQAKQSFAISDADLDWSLNLLKSPDTFVRAKVMGVLMLLSNATADQKQKIKDAVLPLTKSSEALDVQYSKSVISNLRL